MCVRNRGASRNNLLHNGFVFVLGYTICAVFYICLCDKKRKVHAQNDRFESGHYACILLCNFTSGIVAMFGTFFWGVGRFAGNERIFGCAWNKRIMRANGFYVRRGINVRLQS